MLRLIFNRWVLAILGLVAIGLLIWWVGPLIAIGRFRPLEPELVRIVLIAVIALAVLGRLVWRQWKARQSNAQLMQGLASPAPVAPAADRGSEEVATLQRRFEEAIAVLKQASKIKSGWSTLLPGKQYLYDLPWYIFIGAPGSGKTTALVNSGLQFPLVEKLGQQKIRGIGGTRNCDWWFSDQAVFLDTAGRYTTQESDEKSDKTAWSGFLQLLKKYRPRRPINGAIVTVSIADLLQQSATELEQQAAALRARLRELHEDLGIRFPVYVLVTKADLIPGFMEFFNEYGREERAQVWGVTFPLAEKDGPQMPALADELKVLEERLNARVVDRLQHEHDPQARALLYAFPQQFAGARVMLGDFLAQVFESSRFEAQPMVRGVYFTSGTQEGSPIDRIMGQLARALHLEHRIVAPNRPSGKAYFITNLINGVMLPEAGIAGTNLRWERRRLALQLVVLSLAGIVTIGALAAWAISYSRNRAYVADVEAKLDRVTKQIADLPARPTTDVVGLLPALQEVRGLAQASIVSEGDVPWSMQFGLYQGDKLGAASRAAYRRLLQDAFLPRIQARLEEQLRTRGQQNPEFLYEGLKAYIMLSDPQHFDADALKTFIGYDWDTNLPRDVTRDQRKQLAEHLDALFAEGAIASPIIADANLISGARDALARTPIAQRAYNRLRRLGVGANLPEFTITGAAGPNASLVFVRESGQPLTRGVPGLFTYDGYYKTFRPEADKVVLRLAEEESWVLGTGEKALARLTDPRAMQGLLIDVRRIYLEEYARIWEQFVNDIKVIRAGSLQQAIDSTRVLSAPDSPLPVLLRAIVNEVTLVRPEEQKTNIDKAVDALSQLKKKGEDLKKLLGDPGTQAPAAPGAPPIEIIVDAKFDNLRRMVKASAPGQPAPLDASVALIGEMYQLLTATQAALNARMPPPPSEVPTKVKAESGRLPEPLRSVLTILAQAGTTQALGAARVNLDQAIASNVSDFCIRATKGRYPFVKTSTLDVTPDDFARLFAPNGLIDEFFQKNLVAYVDTSARPWKFRQIGDSVMGTSSASLVQFQRAQTIRDVFFRGGPKFGLRLEFKPIEMDTTITQFILDVDGQLIKYNHGPQVPVTVQWPGPRGSMQVRLQLSPPAAGGASGQVFEGPWALFRMLDGTRMEGTNQPEKFVLTFDVDGRRMTFEVLTNSVENPFRLDALAQFQCPERL